MKVPLIAPLTSIRGLAAWWVVLFHFREFMPGGPESWACRVAAYGDLAVDLFFVLSGFVIRLNYARLFETPNWPAAREFAVARFARVYPLHLFLCLVILLNPLSIKLFSTSGLLGDRYDPGYYLLSLLLIQNWGFTDHLAWNAPAWSISTEFGAYILFPVVSFFLSRYVRGRLACGMAVVVPLIALAAVFHWDGLTTLGADIPRAGLARCILEFLGGMAVCHFFQRHGAPRRASQGILLAAAALLASLAATDTVPDTLTLPAAFAMIVLALTRADGVPARLLSAAPLVFLGNISYATYLCHFLVKDWVRFLLVRDGLPSWLPFAAMIGATFVASVLLYRFVEIPCRDRLRRWSRRRPGRAASTGGAPSYVFPSGAQRPDLATPAGDAND